MYVPFHLSFSSNDSLLFGIAFFGCGLAGLIALMTGKMARYRVKWITMIAFIVVGAILLLISIMSNSHGK